MTKRMTKLSVLAVVLLGCAGCVAVWGQSYNVALANSRSVVIEFDPVVVNLPALMKAAQDECDRYGKDAVLDSVSNGNLGIRVNTYRCEVRVPNAVIDVQR